MNWILPIQQILMGINPAVLAALIGAVGIIVGALIDSFVSHRLQQRNKVKTAKEQVRQQKEKEVEAIKTTEERVQAYRDNLRTDPSIAYLQILDMNQSLGVTSIYVRLRLHRETRSNFELASALRELKDLRDPNKLLKATQLRLESRTIASMEPDEAIRKYKHCVIVGDPGAGKTTLLKYLAVRSVDNQLTDLPVIPLYIELKAFASSNFDDLLEFTDARWVKQYSFSEGEAQDYLTDELKKGNILVLLDGLDETFIGEKVTEAEETYRRVSSAVVHFRVRYAQSPIVVTVRKAGYQQRATLDGFTELEVLDFSPKDIQQFVDKWFANPPESQWRARDLNNKFEHNPRIQALAANPLLLSLITIVYEARLDLPSRRADLYKECVDTLIAKWDARRHVRRRRQFTQRNLELLLEEVAWYFHMQRQLYFPKAELLRVIADILPAMQLSGDQDIQILEEITSTNGLLKEQAKDWYGFLHLTFQEYFVAQRIASEDFSDTLLTHINEPWWEEAVLLSAGCTIDASPHLRKLLQRSNKISLEENLFHTNLILAGRYMAASSSIRQTSLQDEITTSTLRL